MLLRSKQLTKTRYRAQSQPLRSHSALLKLQNQRSSPIMTRMVSTTRTNASASVRITSQSTHHMMKKSLATVPNTRIFQTRSQLPKGFISQTKRTFASQKQRKYLITGSNGQIGTALVEKLRTKYGEESVIATDVKKQAAFAVPGPFQYLNVLNKDAFSETVVTHNITHIIHLSALLSAVGEQNPSMAMDLGIDGVRNALECGRSHGTSVFIPSSIAAFGPESQLDFVKNVTVQRPKTVYGITKVFAELLGEYYYQKFHVDFRCLRFPGIIS